MKSNVHYEKTLTLKNGEDVTLRTEYVGAEEYIDFLKRSDLGKQYPKEDFQQRVTDLVQNIQISLIARNKQSQIVGVCFGLTDFAYWLMVTDLGTDRNYAKQGLGKIMMDVAHELAGGEKKIIVFAYANDNAIPFYQKIGMQKTESMMMKDNVEYTYFVVE
ncbi:MAG: GNAT family N-acetyltransferase [Anaerolineae bacterium]|nr:GNAT family N-acetyltransferase [Anaerolineae bacterium]